MKLERKPGESDAEYTRRSEAVKISLEKIGAKVQSLKEIQKTPEPEPMPFRHKVRAFWFIAGFLAFIAFIAYVLVTDFKVGIFVVGFCILIFLSRKM